MPSENVIYFPYINLPNSNWFTNVLFYWDTVYSITPNEYVEYPMLLDAHSRTLVEEHLVKPIKPMDCIHSIPDFNKNFLNFIDTQILPQLGSNPIKNCDTTRIHMEKLGNLADELVERRIAELQQYPWYKVEKQTADQFMLYLASEFGKLSEISAEPVSDDLIHHKLLKIKNEGAGNFQFKMDEIRPLILDSILPAPTYFPDPRDIVAFKEEYHDELVNFRRDIETHLIYLANIEPENREHAISLFKTQKEKDIENIKKRMKSYDWKINMCKFAGYSIAALGAINAAYRNDPVSAFSTAAGVIPPFIQDLLLRKKANPNNMAYAVIAHQKF